MSLQTHTSFEQTCVSLSTPAKFLPSQRSILLIEMFKSGTISVSFVLRPIFDVCADFSDQVLVLGAGLLTNHASCMCFQTRLLLGQKIQ